MRTDHDISGLRPGVRARTILAGCTLATVAPALDGLAGHHGAPVDPTVRPVAGLVEHHGVLHLLMPHDAPVQGRVDVTCRVGQLGLGVLKLTGDAAAPVPLGRVPAAEQAVREGLVPADAADLVPLQVAAVRVLVPAGPQGRAHGVGVPVDEFRASRPDLWLLHGARIVEHLEARHQSDLCALAATDPARRARGAAHPMTVQVTQAGRLGVTLTAIDLDGVDTVRVDSAARIDNPSRLTAWIRSQVIARGGR